MEIFEIFKFTAFAALALRPLDMIGLSQSLRRHVVIIHECDVKVSLVLSIVIWTALFKMVTQPSSPMSLFVRIVARGTVRREASDGGLRTTAVHFTTGYVLDHVNVPPDHISRCPVVGQVAVDFVGCPKVVRLNCSRLLHVAAEGTFPTGPKLTAMPATPL